MIVLPVALLLVAAAIAFAVYLLAAVAMMLR